MENLHTQAIPLPDLNGERVLRLDAETDGLEWWNGSRPVGFAWCLRDSGRRGYSAFAHKGGGNSCSEDAALRWLRDLRGVHIDNANIKFDIHITREWGADLVAQGCTFGDVAHRAALLDDNRFKFGIDQLAQEFLGPDRGKIQLNLDKGDLHKRSADEIAAYAVEDVTLVDDLIRVMDPKIAQEGLERVHALEQAIIPVVCEMEKNGAWLNLDLLHEWQAEAVREYEDTLWFIYKNSGVKISSPDSAKDLEKLFKACSIPITAFTGRVDKNGNPRPSFTGEVLDAIDHPVIKAVRYAGQLADLRSKYLDKYGATVRRDGWIRFNLHQLRSGAGENDARGTVSGRFSSAGDEYGGFNVQQVVRATKQLEEGWCPKFVVRRLFIPKSGCWLAADAAQIEYRIFADYAQSPDIMAAYAKDPQLSYHKVVWELLKTIVPDIAYKHTKITNFCKLYGASIPKFALTLGVITQKQYDEVIAHLNHFKYQARNDEMRTHPLLKQAANVYDSYDKMFPDAARMLHMAKNTAKERGYVKTMMGRRARFGGTNNRVHSALNRVIQGTAADINKLMLVDVYQQRHDLGLTLRFTVHDELDADLDDASRLPRLEEFFNQQRIQTKVPILWDVGVGPNWADAKGKA